MPQGISPAVLEYIQDQYGDLNDLVSTVTYQLGTDGPVRRVVGYRIRGPKVSTLSDVRVRTEDFRFVPVKLLEEEQRLNNDRTVTVMTLNRRFVIAESEEGHLS